MSKRKTVLIHTNYVGIKTGFARNVKSLLTYLYRLDKYDLVLYANGLPYEHPEFDKWPWKTYGSLPTDPKQIEALNRDPGKARDASYGGLLIDKVVSEVKPDIYIGIEDLWGFNKYYEKEWFKNINSCVWTTLDSLPIYHDAWDFAKNTKHFWVWASFAEKAMKQAGPQYNHVRTVHGCIDSVPFTPLSTREKSELRTRFNIAPTTTVFSFVSRNQPRKLFWAILEGFGKFKKLHPHSDVKLLFHTYWQEGWPLERTIKQLKLNPADILTTYVCRNCQEFEIKPYHGEDKDCRFCGAKGGAPNQQFPMGNGQVTTNVVHGVSEENLAKIYGLTDAYIHPMTSGGQEYGLVESLLCGLPMATIPYSCGTDFTDQPFVTAIDHITTRECGTDFLKAVPNTTSIAHFIKKIVDMPLDKRQELGRRGREWALANFDTKVIGKIIEEFIDTCPEVTYSFEAKYIAKNPHAFIPPLDNDKEWVKRLYKELLNLPNVVDEDSGLNYWLQCLKNGMKRVDIENFFRSRAAEDNQQNIKTDIESLFDKEDKGKRILFVMKESIGDLVILTSLFRSCKIQYPGYSIYVATDPKFAEVLDGNPDVKKVIPYHQEFESELLMSGSGAHEGFVDILFLPFIPTQRILGYLQNGLSNPAYPLNMFSKIGTGRVLDFPYKPISHQSEHPNRNDILDNPGCYICPT